MKKIILLIMCCVCSLNGMFSSEEITCIGEQRTGTPSEHGLLRMNTVLEQNRHKDSLHLTRGKRAALYSCATLFTSAGVAGIVFGVSNHPQEYITAQGLAALGFFGVLSGVVTGVYTLLQERIFNDYGKKSFSTTRMRRMLDKTDDLYP